MRATSRPLAQFVACLTILASVLLPAHAQDAAREAKPGGSEKRIALVVGNADYKAGALATPANDAGLVAQTLQAAGFDVVGARDLDEDALRKAMRDFTDKAAASGPDTVAFVYLSGYGLQFAGENYFAPIDAQIASAADVPVQSLRVSDYKRRLASIPLKARFVVLDGARNNPFVKSSDPLAGGLALTEADPGSLIAFNAAPGTVGPEEKGPYSAYAQALVEMIREGGLPPDQLFDRVRLRVSETTQGAEVPWNASKLEPGFVFFQRAADAPKLADPETVSALESRPLKELGPKEAYSAALKRDTVQGYQEFADAYPKERVTKRVRALAAARRESVTWRRTYEVNTPNAYWSYLSRYPRGPHASDCRRLLREMSAAPEPPPRYAAIDYDIPPPPPEEVVYVERPAVYFADPVYDLPPPPPPPVVYLPPPPAYIVDLPPPPPVYDYYALPVPAFAPLPAYVAPPAYIAPPVNNVYYTNIHNTVVINEINRENRDYSERRRLNPALAIGAGAVAGAALGAAAARVALPPAVQQRAIANPLSGGPNPRLERDRPDQANRNGVMPGPLPGGSPNASPGNMPGAGPNGRANLGQPLPGQRDGRPLPQQDGRPGMANRPDDRNGSRPGDRPGDKPDTSPGDRQADQRDDKLRPGFGERRDNDPRIAGRPDPKDRPDAKDRDDPRIAGRPGSKDRPDGKDRDDPRLVDKPGAKDRPDGKDRDDPRIAGKPDLKDRPDTKGLDDPRLVDKPGAKGRPDGKDRDDPRIAGKPDAKDRPDAKGLDDPRLVGKPGAKDRPDGNGRDEPRIAGKPDLKDRPDARDRPQQVGRPDDPARVDRQPDGRTFTPAQQRQQAAQERREQLLQNQAQKREADQARQQAARDAAQQRLQGGARPGDPRGEAAQRQQQFQADRLEKQQTAQAEKQRAAQQRDAAQAQAQAQRQQAQAAAQQQQRAAAQQQQAQQRQMQQQQQAAQRQQMQQQQQAAQRQQMMQQQQQQAAQQRQMMQQQQAQQRQMMMQQQAAQRQQMMSRPPPQPHGGGGGGHGCRPGMPCR